MFKKKKIGPKTENKNKETNVKLEIISLVSTSINEKTVIPTTKQNLTDLIPYSLTKWQWFISSYTNK